MYRAAVLFSDSRVLKQTTVFLLVTLSGLTRD